MNLLKPFLKIVAEDLVAKFGDQISQCCMVFPNRRAHLYFSKYVSELFSKPVWAPDYTTISELMQNIASLQQADSLRLILELYKIYSAEKKSFETFDQFYFWGNMLLNDFDDIDKYLVDASDLFKNLKNSKDIDDHFAYLTQEQIEAIKRFWKSFEIEQTSKYKEGFIEIWEVLNTIYNKYYVSLKSKNIAYEGMVYKEVVNKIKSNGFTLPGTTYIITGFNALSPCEKILFSFLQKNNKALFYWDYDVSFLKNEDHEAGKFIKDNLKNFPSSLTEIHFNNFSDKKKKIEIIAVPSDTGQVKMIPQILKSRGISTTDQYNTTAIILSDEHLLLPILHSIPDEVTEINITMGFPVRSTPVAGFIGNLADLWKNAIEKEKNQPLFHFRNVLSVLRHPFIKNMYPNIIEDMIQKIIKFNQFYISAQELSQNDFLNRLFVKVDSSIAMADYLLNNLHLIAQSLSGNTEITDQFRELERENIYRVYLEIKNLKEIVNSFDVEIKVETFLRILRMLLQKLTIPFTGEPLSGMQIMGILETRALDFENLIILSMNEGIMPKGKNQNSFIPYNLRKGFQLPTFEHQDSIYSYYFYRLIQRAKNITFLYNTKDTGMQSAEMSRFLLQLLYETDFIIDRKTQSFDIKQQSHLPIIIVKNKEIQSILEKYLDEGSSAISPTALISFIECPLRFYFTYVAGMDESKEVSEVIDPAIFGNLLHLSMKELYKPFINKEINIEDINAILKNKDHIETILLHAFVVQYLKNSKKITYQDIQGRNIIIYRVILKYIRQIFEIDKQFTPFTINKLEEKYTLKVPINYSGKSRLINMIGYIDRIDTTQDQIRIIDYKTGSKKENNYTMEQLFNTSAENRNTHSLQAYFYAYLFLMNENHPMPVAPGIYYLRNLFQRFNWHIIQPIGNKEKMTVIDFRELLTPYTEQLTKTFETLFNMSLPFTQTDDIHRCIYCAFKNICQR